MVEINSDLDLVSQAARFLAISSLQWQISRMWTLTVLPDALRLERSRQNHEPEITARL